jgi:hypothetical protein
VVFADVDMPGRLNGFQLARHVQDHHHHRVRVIIGSGKCRPGPSDVAPGTTILQKPYPLENPSREVRRLGLLDLGAAGEDADPCTSLLRGDRMRKLVVAAAMSALVSTAIAQPRPSTTAMSCAQAAGLVASRGAVVLGTGGYTYDRFVSDQRFCLRSERTEPVWVPAGDTRQCFVGYRCKERDVDVR